MMPTILQKLNEGRTSAGRKKIKEGFKAVAQKKDTLAFLLMNGAELENDLAHVFKDCWTIRKAEACIGCVFYSEENYGGCFFYDKWLPKSESIMPEDMKAFLDKMNEQEESLEKRFMEMVPNDKQIP